MSANRETNHGMTSHDRTNSDIAGLLADAADEVEIGIAPYDAVLRGGRRRKARRWAVATATALALAGSAGTLAVAGMPGGDGTRGTSVATSPPTAPPAPDVSTPSRTLLASGTDHGKKWRVLIDVWRAPRDKREASVELAAMRNFGQTPVDVRDASGLVGKASYFVLREYGDSGKEQVVIEDTFTSEDNLSGRDVEAAAMPVAPGAQGPNRLVVGQVASTAQQVTCTWKDGSTTEVPTVWEAMGAGRDSSGQVRLGSDNPLIRGVSGLPVSWFVCVAPEGTEFKSVAVTK
ncbi:hypothetical protein [Streptomyces muensis]|uniref:Uncharacterized protein n=1 Tax=Streptomyces muensis TaxID=1077944 RepID=A0A9X1PX79_STRM4|nr:hypothetical protein [Streptomyces muensis]MCF1593894.1 hypothetical protein [Streptomyces muensis]